MKSLYKYIVESNEAPQYLLLTLEDAKQFFEEHKIFEKKTIQKIGLTWSDIELIYSQSENHPCPIVANYKRKPGHFVFRRWVAKLSDQLDVIDLNIKAAPYQGLHNTNLKEDGKYFPSSEDYEYVIAYSHNKNALDEIDDENIEYVTGRERDNNFKLEQLMLFYVQNEDSCKRIVEPLKGINKKFKKLSSIHDTTDVWRKLGEYTKSPNKTPKTDIISEDGKYKISVKKFGGSQLMSGSEQETRATLLSCIDYIDNEDDKSLLKSVLKNSWYKPKKDGLTISQKRLAGDEELLNAQKSIDDINSKLNKIISNNYEFKMAVLREAATGENKFGKDSNSTANYVLVWDDVKNNNKLYTIDEYLKHCCNYAKFDLSYKTAGSNSFLSFRIINR